MLILASAHVRDRNMSRHKKVERIQDTRNGKPPHPLIGFAARIVRALTAEEQLQGSWDILQQGGEGTINMEHQYVVRSARRDTLPRFHQFYKKYIPYNQRT